MQRFSTRRGYDLRLEGRPPTEVTPGPRTSTVAVTATGHAGLRAQPRVEPGRHVRAGEALFAPRRDDRAVFVAPVDGTVTEVREGARRRLLAVVLRPDEGAEGGAQAVPPSGDTAIGDALDADALRDGMLAAGLWPVLRERPGERLPRSDATPDALFVTAIETEPLAPSPAGAIAAAREDFIAGVAALSRFAPGATWVCAGDPAGFEAIDLPAPARLAVFAGPHPAGLPGTHVSHLAPLTPGRTAWHVGWQDTVAIGRWLRTGTVDAERVVSVAGPGASPPRCLRVWRGACIADLLSGEEGEGPVIAGSAWSGRPAGAPREHLGPFDRVITLPGAPAFRAGGRRWRTMAPAHATGMLAVEALDRAWALDVPVTPLLRALMVGDDETAVALGALDLAEEDLGLVTALDRGGHDFGAYLREALDRVAGEGSP